MDEGREIATQRVRHTLKFVRTQSSGSRLFLGPSKEWSNELIAEQCPSRIILFAFGRQIGAQGFNPQQQLGQKAMGAPATVAAWHNKPSYAILTTEDHMISPDLQRWMYKRSGAKVTEIAASHAVFLSQPDAVAKVIETAAKAGE